MYDTQFRFRIANADGKPFHLPPYVVQVSQELLDHVPESHVMTTTLERVPNQIRTILQPVLVVVVDPCILAALTAYAQEGRGQNPDQLGFQRGIKRD